MNTKILSVFFFIFLVAAVAQEDLVWPGKWDHPAENIPEADFAWKPARYAFENNSLYLLEKLDNGGWLILNFFTFRASIGQKWGVTATLTENNGKRHFFKEEISDKEIETRQNSAFLKMGKCVFDGAAPTYKAELKIEGFSANLIFHNRVPTWKPGKGVTYFTKDKKVFYKNYMICPFSRVSGTIRYNGKTMDAAGWGYGDRGYSNLIFFRQHKYIYAIRGFPKKGAKAKYALSMLEYEAHPSYNSLRIPSIIIMSDSEYLVATKNYKLKLGDYRKDPNTGYTYPWRMEVDGDYNGVLFKLRSQAERLEEVLDVINELPSYIRPFAKKFFSRPVFYRFSGSLTGEITQRNGTKIQLDLHGYSEVVFVQKN